MLKDQVAIVTGGGGGIGYGIARSLAEHGANVVIADILPERCEHTANELKALGVKTLAAPTNVMETDQIRATVALTDKTFGRVDIMVNNVGGAASRPFLEQSERSWRKHIDINLVSVLCGVSAAAPIMIREGRGGSIINVSSIEGARAAPTWSVYAACKAGMDSFTRTMALELGEHNIRVNGIAPDHTHTPGNHNNRTGLVDKASWPPPTQEAVDALKAIIPLGAASDEAACGDVVAFLCSPLARYVTGVIVPVDGGTYASSGWMRASSNGKWTLHDGLTGLFGGLENANARRGG
jgi:NAD(P)-dependent dehydrogenase (short-subunit alcohol dehydrogenase family)